MEFFRSTGDAKASIAMSTYYPKLVKFINENGRFPFSSKVSEAERLLHLFWNRQKRYYNAGRLEGSGHAYHTMILEKYGNLNIDKKDFQWREQYEKIKKAFVTKDSSIIDKEAGQWLYRALRDYRYHKATMPQWKIDCVDEVCSYFDNKK